MLQLTLYSIWFKRYHVELNSNKFSALVIYVFLKCL